MINSCQKPGDSFGFSQEQIAGAIARKGLLSMEIEFSLSCNFNCPYCYAPRQSAQDVLSAAQIDDIILQAKDLGAEKIIILGGEPMIYPSIHERIRFIRKHGLDVEMFTNGSHMNPENARFMFENNVAVVLKMNSVSKTLQNEMTGRDDAYDIIQTAFQNLTGAGYPAPGRRLAVSTVICGQNIDELPAMWRRLRRRGIEPYFEMITPQGGAAGNHWQDLPVSKQQELFEELARIDREEFGRTWRPQPPLVGNSCLRHCYSCLVNASGQVMPCVGVTIPLGNVLETPLKTILDRSEVMENLRNYPRRIKGPCAACDNAGLCYGCRGAAYQLTGDYLASDPLCWHNQDKELEALPTDAAPYLPHRPPMLMIDTLCNVGERSGHLAARIKDDNPFLSGDGILGETAYIELIAQAVAALEGFHMSPAERAQHKGVLLAVKRFSISRASRRGEKLDIHLEKLGRFGDFGAVSGVIMNDGAHVAGGELSFFQSGPEAGAGDAENHSPPAHS